MLILDLSHTSHTQSATGIQQVCRHLYTELCTLAQVRAVVHDPWQRSWRLADAGECARLVPGAVGAGARRKGERWKGAMKLRGFARRMAGIDGPLPDGVRAALFPEFTAAHSLAAVGQLRDLLPPGTPFLAVFHDAIALRMPEYCARATVERMPSYVSALAGFDAVAAVSEASRSDLQELWKRMGIAKTPPVAVIHPGVAPFGSVPQRERGARPRFLCVATLEPRKNHEALLDAAESLWEAGLEFELELVGMAHSVSGAPIEAKIGRLRASGRPLEWLGAVDDATLRERYAACDYSIYCSLMEGYGLPVAESVACGRPCLCTSCGGLAEVSAGGGCLRIDATDAAAIAKGMGSLIRDPGLAQRLICEARARPVRTWADYASDIRDWAEGPRSPHPFRE